ncbi:family 16 glycoside hydrolase [Paenibacillus daejeonensis]|uniref:family 16 glycoside hydrolase n=1 Tax=Paenibacillus daejeonensis TaxID=135193 RepID=UPI000365E84D|nr:family 16 glycoside hydrolase [Paenibacillus daejeonensis]
MRKVVSLLLIIAVMLTGILPQSAGADEIYEYDYVASTDSTDEDSYATLLETTDEAAIIQNYPMPSIYTPSSIYSLRADQESVPVIQYKPEYDYAQFSFAGTVSIEITANEPITSYSISPLAKNIEGTVDGNKLTFTLSTSTYVIVDINEDPNERVDESDPAKIRKRLVIAADPLETDIPDASGPGIYNVTAEPYNADNTGATITSDAIQQAIDDAHQAGGGTVFIPAGVYTSSNLTLKSNVDFYLAGGAVIVGTGRGEDYRNDFRKDSLSRDGTYFIQTAIDSENITMRGRGTIDGKGVEMRNRKMTAAPPTHKQGEGFINNLLVPIATSNFKFDGLTLRDGGFWAFMVVRSDNVTITNYKVYQDLRMLENDGIDINESQNVLVKHALAISDDDAYSTKTWPQMGMSKDWPGAIEHLENVVFDDCFAWTRTAAFKLGMGICTPQINVTIRNSYVYQSARALLVDHAFTSNPLPEEGYAQNVTFENIDIERVGINQFGNYWFRVSTSTSGDVSNILFKNINVRQTGGTSQIQGNPTRGGMVDGLTFSDVYVKGVLATSLNDLKASVRNENVKGVVFANTIPPIFSDDFEDGTLDKWQLRSEDRWTIQDEGGKVLSSGNRTSTSLLIAKEGASWTDYSFEARTHPHLANGKENAGLIFRVTDADNYYMYRINADAKRLELFKAIGGTLTRIQEADTAFTPAKQWYTIKVIVQGNTIEAYVDGEPMTSWTNPDQELSTGGVGFRTTSAHVKFDDVIVSALNRAPTDITLSNHLIAENTRIGSFIGAFSTEDPDQEGSFSYTLVEGEGDTDNRSFSISVLGNTLVLRTELDYETKDSYSIRVRSTDSGGLYYEKSFTILVTEVNDLPIESDPDNVLYSDDFAEADIQDWTANGGTWRIATEEDANILVQRSSTPALFTTGDDSWTDYSYEADVRLHISNANAGLVFRVEDSSNFYMYRLNGSNRRLELYKSVDGTMTLLSSANLTTVAAKQWYTLKVLVYGNSIKGYLDGQLQLEWNNPITELAAGSIGLRTTSSDTAFRHILVTGIRYQQSEVPLADASKNTVTLDRSSVTAGDTVTITAAGDRQHEIGTVAGEERYYPVEWSSTELGKSGEFTTSEQVYSSSYTTSTEGQYVVEVTFQKQSWDGDTWNDITTDMKTAALTVTARDNGGGTTPPPTDNGGGITPPPTDNGGNVTPPPTDNEDEEPLAVGISTETTTEENGISVTTVSIDPARLEQKIAQEVNGAIITVPVQAPSDKIVVELTGQMVKDMEAKGLSLQIKTDKATYTLSAAQINMDALAQQMGSQTILQDIKIQITIAMPATDIVKQVQDAAERQGYQVVAQPLEFKIIASRSTSADVEITNFEGYVHRTLALPEGFHSGTSSTGVVLHRDGSISHVPTKAIVIDGKPHAAIASLTNSVYAVVSGSKTFADIDTHWAQEAINDLGSRLVIDGSGEGKFEPGRNITRAEFAAIIIRGLGLVQPGTGNNTFHDVTTDDWYYDVVAIAHKYGIINGFEDGAFRPAEHITREQAMTMIARAMQLTGLNVELTTDAAVQLQSKFVDAGDVADYALHSMSSGLQAGIINGRDGHVLAPKDPMTRAEVAVIVTRLLQQSGLI